MDLPLVAKWHWVGNQKKSDYLIVVLHGRGDSPAGFDWFPAALELKNTNFVMLQAPFKWDFGFSWYDLPPNQGPGIQQSSHLLAQTLDTLFANGFLPHKTFLFGFSQGCLMTLEFGSRYSNVLAGYIGVSGYCYDVQKILDETSADHKKAPWLITHGLLEEMLPAARTRAQIQQLQDHGFNIQYQEFEKNHTIDDELELPLIRNWFLEKMGKG